MGKYCPGCTGSGGNVKIRVNYAAIAKAFTEAGMFAPEIHELAAIHLKLAERLSPKRTGRMAASHYKRVMPAKGFTRDYFVGVGAEYARFVRYGTAGNGAGYIFPKTHAHLILRPAPYSYFGVNNPGRVQSKVHGQKAQRNWLGLAAGEAMAFMGLGRPRFPELTEGL
jgi:hypothetical protein